jgi:hypothetical protein
MIYYRNTLNATNLSPSPGGERFWVRLKRSEMGRVHLSGGLLAMLVILFGVLNKEKALPTARWRLA